MLSLFTTYLLIVVYTELIRIFEFLVFQNKVILCVERWNKKILKNNTNKCVFFIFNIFVRVLFIVQYIGL
jgi:hypothetical protein